MRRTMNIGNKILLSLSILVLGFSLTIAYGFITALQNNARLEVLSSEVFPASQLSQQALTIFEEQIKIYQDMVATGDIYMLSAADEKAVMIMKTLEELEKTVTDVQLKKQIAQTIRKDHRFNASAPWVYKEMRKSSTEYNAAMMEKADILARERTDIRRDLEYYRNYFTKKLNSELALVGTSIKRQGNMNVLIFIVTTGLSLAFVIFMIMHYIRTPLQNTINAFSTGAMGDFSVRLDDTSGDEIGRLAYFFNTFMEKLEIYNRELHEKIEQHRRSEEALRSSEELYTKLVNTIPEAVVRTNLEGDILFVNDYTLGITGYSREELVGRNLYSLIPAEEHEKALKNITLMLNGVQYERDYSMIMRDGSLRSVEISGDVLRSEDGAPSGLVYACRDITERRQAEQEKSMLQKQLVQAQKMESIGRLAGGVAHDFNNMLSVIIGNAEMAMEGLPSSDPILKTLRDILSAGERSADLTRQLLAFARKQTINPKVLNLNIVIKGMFKMLQRLIGEDIKLVLEENPELWPVRMDPTQVDQILANLVVNARDAIENTGIITIELINAVSDEAYCSGRPDCLPGEYVVLVVSDNGAGMDKMTMSNIFEPFFTTKREGHGTGLGLATVYGIVRQNNGFVNVYSEPGKGTTFRIHLPRCVEEGIEAKQIKEEVKIRGGKETILVVEDELRVLNLTKEMLEKLGYRVLIANSTADALQLANEFESKIDLLLTDVVMPDMNGRELFHKIDMIRPGTRCLFMSGYTANVIAHHGILDQGVHFIPKPFTMQGLAEKIRDVLDR